jgi:hypothetical protein
MSITPHPTKSVPWPAPNPFYPGDFPSYEPFPGETVTYPTDGGFLSPVIPTPTNEHRFWLRKGFEVVIALPTDVTYDELHRLTNFLEILQPFPPEKIDE